MRARHGKYGVYLTDAQRAELESLCRQQRTPAITLRRAKILLLADDTHGLAIPDREIAEQVGLCERQVVRIRQKFVREGDESTLVRQHRQTPPIPWKLDGRAEARLVALCCSTPPKGRQRWTLQLLVDELCRLKVVTSVCPETVRKCLKKTGLSLGPAVDSASQNGTEPVSSRRWKRSSTSTAKSMIRKTR